MPVSSLVSYFGDSAGTHFGTLREVWVFGGESHWLSGLRGPGVLVQRIPSSCQVISLGDSPPHSWHFSSFFTFDGIEAGCSQEEGPRKGFVMGSRTRGVQEILEKCM